MEAGIQAVFGGTIALALDTSVGCCQIQKAREGVERCVLVVVYVRAGHR